MKLQLMVLNVISQSRVYDKDRDVHIISITNLKDNEIISKLNPEYKTYGVSIIYYENFWREGYSFKDSISNEIKRRV